MPGDVLVLCRRLPPSPPRGWERVSFCGVTVRVVQGPAIEAVLGRPLPFKAPKALLVAGTEDMDTELVVECLEPLVDAVAGELWTLDGRVIYRGQGPRLSLEELTEMWRGIVHAHQLKKELASRQSHARRTVRAPKGPGGVAKAWAEDEPDEPDEPNEPNALDELDELDDVELSS